MPKIRWTDLPPSLRQHLFDRVADRQIPAEDLYKLKLWRESEPEAPAGPWYKDFGSFKICGEGELPKTFLLKGQPAKGEGSVAPFGVVAAPVANTSCATARGSARAVTASSGRRQLRSRYPEATGAPHGTRHLGWRDAPRT